MKIGIDFDRVLFDTDSFNEYLKDAVDGLEHVDTAPYNEHGVYSPEMHAELCGIDVEKIFKAMEDLDRFLYSDISQLGDTDHEVVIVTRGEKKFQERKIEATEAQKFVDNVVIVEKGSKDVAEIEFLVDDQKGEIEKADMPGFEFGREKHSLKDALKEAEDHAA
jgi:hypothetical protein